VNIQLPHNWHTRPYQDRLWRYLAGGGKRAAAVWHRRSGKDEIALHWTATAAMERVATYWHMLPKANQARKAIWEAVNPHTGKRRVDEAFPLEIRSLTREQEMMIKFVNGSTWQVVGADNFNALVGSPPAGIVFSEYSLADPQAWDYLRPILAENGGWALFIYTARGKNHGYTLHTMASRNPDWFSEILSVEDTKAIPLSVIEDERKSGMSEDMIQQEYYCSFEASNPGAYYGKQMTQARKDQRIGRVPIEPGVPCETWWDLGMDDAMSVWITQTVVREIRCVHYYEHNGEGLAHYANYLDKWADDHDVRFARHGMPHDIQVRELGTGKSRKEVCEVQLGLRPIVVAPQLDLESGIEQVRRLLAQCWFDETECERGISALTEYTKEWDEKSKVFAARPLHNWASHGADAFRTMAMIHKGRSETSVAAPRDRYADRNKRRGGTWMSS
jgi:phage terminase large subunit